MAHPDPIPEGIEVPNCQHATGYIRGRSGADADPAAFGRLLNFIADRGVSIWFDEGGMYWRASEEDVDAEFLRLLRQFKESLRQAYGPPRLPLDDPEEASGRGRRHARNVKEESVITQTPVVGVMDLDPLHPASIVCVDAAIFADRSD